MLKSVLKEYQRWRTLEICYRNNPNEPEIVCEAQIFGDPTLFRLVQFKRIN